MNKRLDVKDIFEIYYCYIDLDNEIICHEDNFSNLSEDQKKNIGFVVLKNRKIRVLANRFIFIPVSNYRNLFNSFIASNFTYNGTYPIPKNYLDLIKTKEPLFPFSTIDSYYTGSSQHDINIRSNNIQRIVNDNVNYNPYFLYNHQTQISENILEQVLVL